MRVVALARAFSLMSQSLKASKCVRATRRDCSSERGGGLLCWPLLLLLLVVVVVGGGGLVGLGAVPEGLDCDMVPELL